MSFFIVPSNNHGNAVFPVGGLMSYTLNVEGASTGYSYGYNTTDFHFSIKGISENSSVTELAYTSDNDTYFNNAFGFSLNPANNTFYLNKSNGYVLGSNAPATIPFYTPANFTLYENYTSGYYFLNPPMYYNVTSLSEPYQLFVDGSYQTVDAWKLTMTNQTLNQTSNLYQVITASLLFAKDTSTLLYWDLHARQLDLNNNVTFQVNLTLKADEGLNMQFVILDSSTSASSYDSSSVISSNSSTSVISSISLAGFEILPLFFTIILAKKLRKKL